jgi:hypothetical protein
MSIFSLNIVFLLVWIFLPFFVIFVGGVCLSLYYTCFLSVCFGCAGSVGISLAGWVIYFLCGTPLCGVPGRYNLFVYWPEVDGGTVHVFSSLALL